MISIKKLRTDFQKIEKALKSKGYEGSLNDIISVDEKFRTLTYNLEQLRAKKNNVSEQVAIAKRNGEDFDKRIKEMRDLGDEIKVIEVESNKLKLDLTSLLEQVPNLPHESVPIGIDENDNVIVREWGEKKIFDFNQRTHLELSASLNLLDMERGAKISGSGFPIYIGKGAELERKLINCMIEHHVNQYNFTEMFPPVLMLEESMKTTGQLPKFKEDMYFTELDQLYLAPTAEVPITNVHRNEIIPESDLPISYVAYSPCFRRESGSYGKDTRGLLRLHQFNKVEMVKFVNPVDSYNALEELTLQAESILQKLGITYRVVELCTGDLSFAAAKCYDIEIWSPGEKKWLEVSSCSNFEDFQARRGKIRYRKEEDKKVGLLE